MRIIQLREQLIQNTQLTQSDSALAIQYIEDGMDLSFCVKRGREPNFTCLSLYRNNQDVYATGMYYVGLDWIKENDLAVQVYPKMNDGAEIDYVRMLNESLCDVANFDHLNDLLTINFNKPAIRITQQNDYLSIFLVTEFLHLLRRITQKGLKKSYYPIVENLTSKVRGKILVGRTIRKNVVNGKLTDNVCQYQVYDIDTPENRILKKALRFCIKQIAVYKHSLDTSHLEHITRYVKPYFENVGDEVSIKAIESYKGNPVFKEYNQAVQFAKLLLRRYSYDITAVGNKEIETPPFWIDMSKLFELYVYHNLRQIFTAKNEIQYHVHANYQELDYLLKPQLWAEPYVIDAKYKPHYKNDDRIAKEDARQVSGYARLSTIYQKLGLSEDAAPIKCLIIYPDQEQEEQFGFTRDQEPTFDKVSGYVRIYKLGIRLPIVNNKIVI